VQTKSQLFFPSPTLSFLHPQGSKRPHSVDEYEDEIVEQNAFEFYDMVAKKNHKEIVVTQYQTKVRLMTGEKVTETILSTTGPTRTSTVTFPFNAQVPLQHFFRGSTPPAAFYFLRNVVSFPNRTIPLAVYKEMDNSST